MNSTASKSKVLLVEDDALSSRVNSLKLAREQVETLSAVDGEDAMQKLKDSGHEVGVVLLDLMLPKINGFEVLERMKKDPTLEKIPVVVLTDLGQDSDRERVLGLGANEYLIKTETTIDQIVTKVKKYLKD